MEKVIYAVGDVHGKINKLKGLYTKILQDYSNYKSKYDCEIIFLGDYIDRGEDSRGVLNFLMSLEDTDKIKHTFLLGNHELMLMDAYKSFHDTKNPLDTLINFYLIHGGRDTMHSYDVKNVEDFFRSSELKSHLNWMYELLLKYKINDFVFVHAGYDFRIPYNDQNQNVLLWKRTKNKNEYKSCDYVIIHGHTPITTGVPEFSPNEINADTGACFDSTFPLTAIKLFTDKSHLEADFLQYR